MIERYDFAPLDGITKAVYRRVWSRFFGGADRCLIPYFSPTKEHILTKREQIELLPENNPNIPLIPQVMASRAPELIWASEILRDMGYPEINLNAGCPSGTVTAKGKGAGLLLRPDALDALLDGACGQLALPLSVKARIGFASPDEFPRLLEIFNRYPLQSLTLHIRVRKDKYKGTLYYDAFALALRESRNPIAYNGDLRTVAEIDAFASRFPDARAVMIGRGGVADPALFRKLRGGPPASRDELQAFTSALFDEYAQFYRGDIGLAARRMREVWFYLIHLFDDAKRLNKAMRRFRTADEYLSIAAEIFRTLPLRTDSAGDLV